MCEHTSFILGYNGSKMLKHTTILSVLHSLTISNLIAILYNNNMLAINIMSYSHCICSNQREHRYMNIQKEEVI